MSGRAPAWARQLTAEVCAAAGVPEPRLGWRRVARESSSGVARLEAGTVSVSAGSHALDQRLTLLHELAHWLGSRTTGRRARRRRAHHDAAFYASAFALYRAHAIPDPDALALESRRYPSALRHARGLGIAGANEAWAVRRAELRDRAARRPAPRVLVAEHVVRLVRDGRWTRCSVCGVRVVGPVLARLRRRGGRHLLLATG
ncbi:MAG TPA: hypothetical protein VJA85_01350 [Candidatus Limnocylindria bacterium]|nr:hypothetical protein [Candidatus Limnocylindria bacterium]